MNRRIFTGALFSAVAALFSGLVGSGRRGQISGSAAPDVSDSSDEIVYRQGWFLKQSDRI